MKLTPSQYNQVCNALLDGYNIDTLDHMVRVALDTDLDHIVPANNLIVIVHNLVRWAEQHDRLHDLVAGAANGNRTNAALQNLATDYLLWSKGAAGSPDSRSPLLVPRGKTPALAVSLVVIAILIVGIALSGGVRKWLLGVFTDTSGVTTSETGTMLTPVADTSEADPTRLALTRATQSEGSQPSGDTAEKGLEFGAVLSETTGSSPTVSAATEMPEPTEPPAFSPTSVGTFTSAPTPTITQPEPTPDTASINTSEFIPTQVMPIDTEVGGPSSIEPIYPENNHTGVGYMVFEWEPDRPLEADQVYELVFWKAGETYRDGMAQIEASANNPVWLSIDLPTGTHHWGVWLATTEPEYRRIRYLGDGNSLFVGAGSDPSRGDASTSPLALP
jgi:hypothetical protein